MTTLLDVKVVRSRYGPVEVLRDVGITADAGEVVAVLGANGAGKTTLLRTISGVKVRAQAKVFLGGRDISRLSGPARVRAGIAHVPEGRRVFTDLTVLENLRVVARARKSTTAEERADLDQVFSLFPRLDERRQQKATSLSGGEQQMLAIGRGLMCKPRVLMVDEASLGLAPAITQSMFATLTRLAEGGLAILLVEQNARASLEIARRAYILERGTVRLAGPAGELLHDERLAATYLGGHMAAGEEHQELG